MLYQTSIPIEAVDEDEFRDLVNRLAKLSGQKVEIQHQLIVLTDSTDLTSILDAMADTIRAGGSIKPAQKKLGGVKKSRRPKGEKQKAAKPKAEPTRGPHVRSIRVNGNGEMISRFELNRRLLEHKIEAGTVLHSPKYGKLIVQNGGSDSVPLTLVDESGKAI